jgi:chemotaxis protein CheC
VELTNKHRETLSELINIGYGRAAASLSDLTGQRIVLEAPKIEIHPLSLMKQSLSVMLKGEVSSVHQIFSGAVSGHALLLVDTEAADALAALVLETQEIAGNMRAARREALVEVGNILLQAAMGVCGNLLRVHVMFSIPRLHIDTIDDLLNSLTIENQELQYALLVQTRFELLEGKVAGYLLVILGITSFSRLLEELDHWERRELSV